MGYFHSAYFVYGVYIPPTEFAHGPHLHRETERIQAVLTAGQIELSCVGVGYLTAGDYDRDHLFLTADVEPDEDAEVILGSYRRLIPETDPAALAPFNAKLERVVSLLGYDRTKLDKPGWIVVPDLS